MTTYNKLFIQALYSQHSIPEVLANYENLLKTADGGKGNIETLAHAAKITSYRKLIVNKKFLSTIRRIFNDIYNLLDKNYPDLRFSIDGRRKSVISTEKKIRYLIGSNKSLDLLRDLFAFRIVIFEKDSLASINTCYNIAIASIKYFIERGFTLCEADPVEIYDLSHRKDIFIPSSSLIPEKFQMGVKDYILHPKENAYQSLHITFRAPTGECFEIQIRTFDMHMHAESGDAAHFQYKRKKYSSNDINFEARKVQIPGYGISSTGKIFDFIGLECALEILKRQKTY